MSPKAVKSAKKASRGRAAAAGATAGKPSATEKVAAADAKARTFLQSKRQPTAPGTHIRTRAERRAEAGRLIAGRDITKLNVKQFKQVRDILGIQELGGESRGPSARRTYLRLVREALGPQAGSGTATSPES